MDESLEEEGRDKQVGIEGVGVELSGEGSPGRRMKTGTNRTGMGLGNLVRPSKIKGREHIRLWAIDRLVLPQADPKFQRFNVSEKNLVRGRPRKPNLCVPKSTSSLLLYRYSCIAIIPLHWSSCTPLPLWFRSKILVFSCQIKGHVSLTKWTFFNSQTTPRTSFTDYSVRQKDSWSHVHIFWIDLVICYNCNIISNFQQFIWILGFYL